MTDKPRFQFWFDFASPYSFLSAMRIGTVTTERAIEVEWKPFMLGVILRERGWQGTPADAFPIKGRYMWRDITRRAARSGVRFKRPKVFPRNPLLANRVAQVGAAEGWCAEFARRTFHANFVEDREIGEATVLSEIVAACGRDAGEVLARAESASVKSALRDNTLDALRLGIFGAPSFVVDGELFWGDDRLEDALGWYAGERL